MGSQPLNPEQHRLMYLRAQMVLKRLYGRSLWGFPDTAVGRAVRKTLRIMDYHWHHYHPKHRSGLYKFKHLCWVCTQEEVKRGN